LTRPAAQAKIFLDYVGIIKEYRESQLWASHRLDPIGTAAGAGATSARCAAQQTITGTKMHQNSCSQNPCCSILTATLAAASGNRLPRVEQALSAPRRRAQRYPVFLQKITSNG
jgi:hypothetical protein